MGKSLNLILYLTIILFVPISTRAAALTFSPLSGSYNVGNTFQVNINIDSAEQSANAASVVVSFPWDKLEVVSFSKQNSIFSLWPTEPAFSNSQGTLSFEGVVLNPGYIGLGGKAMSVTFRAKSAGTANVSFASGSVLANDGTGTNIVDSFKVAVFSILDTTTTVAPISNLSIEETSKGNNLLNITSSTHPEESVWYINNTPEFSWQLPEGAQEIRTVISKSPKTTPFVSYIPPISKKKVDELPDGTYYFGLQVRTSKGWSEVSRYRVNIDTTPPRPFSIAFPHGNTGWEPQPVILFDTIDDQSGISHYDVRIGNDTKPVKTAPSANSNPYVLPAQLPGTYTLFVTAFDNAGNIRNSSTEFVIESIESPKIIYFPEKLKAGDIMKISGTTYPNSDVNIFVREGSKLFTEEYAKSNSLGDFSVVVSRQSEEGIFAITARVKDSRGAQSNESVPVNIVVESEIISDVVGIVLKYLSVSVLAILVIALLFFVSLRLWFKISKMAKRLRGEARQAERTSESNFRLLRKDINDYIKKLKSIDRKLTKEEIEFIDKFEKDVDSAEKEISKGIRGISGR